MQDDYLAKWLNGELEGEELASFEQSEGFATYRRIKELSGSLAPPRFDAEEAYLSFQAQRADPVEVRDLFGPFRPFLRVAAVLAVVILVGFLALRDSRVHREALYASRDQFSLPDGSQVVLNAGSELAFHQKGWDDKRSVSLSGEAYFQVAKGERFEVVTDAGTVAVLGTEFLVEHRDGFFEARCFEGRVEVRTDLGVQILSAGDAFVRIGDGEGRLERHAQPAPTWLKDGSSFRSVPLRFVFAELERQFDIEVETRDVDLDRLFTGTFSNTDLKIALESISAPARLTYERQGDRVLFYAGNTAR